MSHNSLRITNAFFFTNLMKLQKLDLVREESSLNWIEFFPNLTVIKGRLREIKLCQGSSEGTTWKILRTSQRISGYDRILFEKNLTPESTQVESHTISVVSYCVLCSFQSHQ